MDGQRVGYVRVSGLDPNPDRQLEAVCVARTFTDKASGSGADRRVMGGYSTDWLQGFYLGTLMVPARMPDATASRIFA
jgi:hypothetical protein